MKKLFLSLFLLATTISHAQFVDSMTVHVGKLNIQARDAEAIRQVLSNSDVYDELLDSLTVKFRKNPKPQGSDVIVVDSVTIISLINLSRYMRRASYEEVENYYVRVNTAIRAITNPFLLRRLNQMDTTGGDKLQAVRQDGRRRFLGKQ